MKTKDIQVGVEYACGRYNTPGGWRKAVVLEVGAERQHWQYTWSRHPEKKRDGIRVRFIPEVDYPTAHKEEVLTARQVWLPWDEHLRNEAARKAAREQATMREADRRQRTEAVLRGFSEHGFPAFYRSDGCYFLLDDAERLLTTLRAGAKP